MQEQMLWRANTTSGANNGPLRHQSLVSECPVLAVHIILNMVGSQMIKAENVKWIYILLKTDWLQQDEGHFLLLEPPHLQKCRILWEMFGCFGSFSFSWTSLFNLLHRFSKNCLNLHWTCCIGFVLLPLGCSLLQAYVVACLPFGLFFFMFSNLFFWRKHHEKKNLPSPLQKRPCSTAQYIWLLSLIL